MPGSASAAPGGAVTIQRLQVVIEANTAGLSSSLAAASTAAARSATGIGRSTSAISSAFRSVAGAAAAALSVGALVSFGKQAVSLGSDLTEVQNVVDVTFKDMAADINEFARSALNNFGLSETSAKQYASTIGAMFKSMGVAQKDVYGMSTAITGLAADMASFYNLDTDEAFYKIRAGISGETEPLKALGINMSVANLEAFALSRGIETSYKEMDQASQAILRYNYLLSVTGDAQGDFARTAGTWANQTRILKENFNAIKTTIGQGMVAALTPLVQVLNQVLVKLQDVAKAFREWIYGLVGYEAEEAAQGVSDAVGAIQETVPETDLSVDVAGAEDLADDIKASGKAAEAVGQNLSDGVAKAAKSAQGWLGSLDEISRIGSGGGPADVQLATLDKGAAEDVEVPVPDVSAYQGMAMAIDQAAAYAQDLKPPIEETPGLFDVLIEGLREKWRGLMERFGIDWDELWPRITGGAKEAWDECDKWIREKWDDLTKWLDETWTRVWDGPIGDAVRKFVDFISETLVPVLSGTLDDVIGLIDNHILPDVSGIMEDLITIMEVIAPVTEGVLEKAILGLAVAFNGVLFAVGVFLDGVKAVFDFVAGIFEFVQLIGKAWKGTLTEEDVVDSGAGKFLLRSGEFVGQKIGGFNDWLWDATGGEGERPVDDWERTLKGFGDVLDRHDINRAESVWQLTRDDKDERTESPITLYQQEAGQMLANLIDPAVERRAATGAGVGTFNDKAGVFMDTRRVGDAIGFEFASRSVRVDPFER